MLCFDIGANRGDFTAAALAKGYDIVALEPGAIFNQLVKNFIYNPHVIPLKMAASMSDYETVEFYEAEEDGLSTLNKDWLTDSTLPYCGKPFKQVMATTITLDTLALKYGVPDLIKIDVEGAEWHVFKGLSSKMGTIAFEWTFETMADHQLQLEYLAIGGYTEVAPQYIVEHCEEPKTWFPIADFNLEIWHSATKRHWEDGGWKSAGLRPTADVGMLWVR